MANYTLTTTAQEVGRNTSITVGGRLLAWYSNPTSTSATVHLKLQAISQGITYTGTNKDYQLVLDNTDTGTVPWSYQPLTQDTWIDVVEITQSVAYGRTVNVSGKIWTYVYGDAWITGNTVRLNPVYVAPTTPTVSVTSTTSDSLTASYGTTSYGTPSTGTVTLFGGISENPTDVWATSTTTGANAFTQTGLNANTLYYLRTRAYNNQLYSGFATTTGTTLPPAFTVEATEVGEDSATLSYSKPADGGALTETLYYSLDSGSTWTSIATTSTGEALSGTFTLSGLTPETSYTVTTKLTTTGGDYDGPTVTFTTGASYKLYGSVNDVTERIEKLYGPVPVYYYSVSSITNQTNFNPGVFNNKYRTTYGPMTVQPSAIFLSTSGQYTIVSIGFSNGSSKQLFGYLTANYNYAGRDWGWSNIPPANGTISSNQYIGNYVTKQIDKLYGSVNGVTKRIF